MIRAMTEYGKRLREAREGAGLKQQELAKRTGLAQSTVSTAERKGHSSGDTAVYAQACGVNALWLATGEGPKYPTPGDAPAQAATCTPAVSSKLPELTPAAYELGMLFDLIPVTDRKKRAQAHVAASSAILGVLEGHENVVPEPDRKTRSV